MDWNERLMAALEADDIDQVAEALAHGADPNLRLWDGRQSALYVATLRGSAALMRLLVGAGATVSSEREDEETSLHHAAEEGNLELLQMLLAAGGGAVLNTFDYICRTPLMWAVDAGHIEVVRVLIDAGSDVNARDEAHIGNTALHLAVEKERAEMVELLLRAGADPSAPGWMMLTPLYKAEQRKSPEGKRVLELLRSPASVRAKPLSNRKRRRQRSSPE